MTRILLTMSAGLVLTMGLACKPDSAEEKHSSTGEKTSRVDDKHAEGDGHDHADDDGHDHGNPARGDDHGHDDGHGHGHADEATLGMAKIGDLVVAASQGHGEVRPGKESHLVVKLPYADNGATVVRAWLGTENRTLSLVARGEYEASGGKYNVHAVAPRPLPAGVMWWIEIEKPDGVTLVGSIKPLLD